MRAALISLACLAWGGTASAQEIEPRAYSNTPVGINFLVVGYAYADGGLAVDPTVPLEDADIRSNVMLIGWARSIDAWGRSAKIDVAVPYAWTSGNARFDGELRERDVDGWLDPRFRFSINLFGAPAMTLREFADFRQDLIIGVSLQVRAPWSQYDAERLLNNGTNRWSAKAEVGASKARGPWRLEAAGAVTLIEDNDDFLDGGTLEQDPIYSIQGHLVYTFPRGAWASLDGTWYTGGRTTVDGVPKNDLQRNTRVGLTLALPLGGRHSLKLYASTGVETRTGSDADLFGAAWQYRWGGGL